MPYVKEEGGRLNNYAEEPRVYTAEPPTKAQQRNYIILGTISLLLVGFLILVAFFVSKS
jgi:hypothetical protein